MSLCTAYVNLKTWLAAILDITLSDTVTQSCHHLTPPKKAGKAVEKQKKEKLLKYQELSNKTEYYQLLSSIKFNHQKKNDKRMASCDNQASSIQSLQNKSREKRSQAC